MDVSQKAKQILDAYAGDRMTRMKAVADLIWYCKMTQKEAEKTITRGTK